MPFGVCHCQRQQIQRGFGVMPIAGGLKEQLIAHRRLTGIMLFMYGGRCGSSYKSVVILGILVILCATATSICAFLRARRLDNN